MSRFQYSVYFAREFEGCPPKKRFLGCFSGYISCALTFASGLQNSGFGRNDDHLASAGSVLLGGALAKPDGPFGVGLSMSQLIDKKRHDPWVPSKLRRLMVSQFEPCVHVAILSKFHTCRQQSRPQKMPS